jgi:hypothetical protein
VSGVSHYYPRSLGRASDINTNDTEEQVISEEEVLMKVEDIDSVLEGRK